MRESAKTKAINDGVYAIHKTKLENHRSLKEEEGARSPATNCHTRKRRDMVAVF